MAAERTEFSFEGPAAFEEESKRQQIAGLGPWRLALRLVLERRRALERELGAFGGH